ncbi:MAG: hypothetical protein P8Y70_01090 [Candidatus Lokiarchaeota archaeon]
MAVKGYLWSLVFILAGLIFSVIPTYLIFTWWVWLNEFTFNGEPIYTLTLFALFVWIISLLVAAIYYVATVRAILQRKNEDLGISKGVKGFGAVSIIIIIGFMIIWFILTRQIAFFTFLPH